jgi:hypothetical protein
MAAFGAAIALIGTAALFRSRAPSPAPEIVTTAVEAAPVPPAPSVPTTAESPSPKPSAERRIALTFAARVREAQGLALAPRTPCTLDVEVTERSSRSYAPKLACGANVLYDGTTSGMRMISSSGIMEVAGDAPDGWRYRLLLQQKGMTDSLGLNINTEEGTIEAWSEKPPVHRVVLDVDELSLERRGEPLSPASAGPHAARAAFATEAKVTSATGAAPVKKGAVCSVRLQPALEAGRCRAKLRVRCGATTLYGKGTTGYASCEAKDGKVTSFTDTELTPADGDPAVDLDVASASLRIRDESPTQKYEIVMAFSP